MRKQILTSAFTLATPLLAANLLAADFAMFMDYHRYAEDAFSDAAGVKIHLNINKSDASKGDVSALDVLEAAEISVKDITPGTSIEFMNAGHKYDGQAFGSPKEGPNVLTQTKVNGPITFTMKFSKRICRFAFKRPNLIAGTSGITHPRWSVRALDANMNEVTVSAEEMVRYFDRSKPSPERLFTMNAPEGSKGFDSVRISSDGDLYGHGSPGSQHFTAFSGVLMSSIVIAYCPNQYPTNPGENAK